MKCPRWLFVLVVAPAVALAQEEAALPPATGTVLLDAAPARADLLLHTPDLPALLRSAEEAGLGGGAVWRAAFDKQMADWAEAPDLAPVLVKASRSLLGWADGEVLVCSMWLPGAQDDVRATLFAMRSSARGARLLGAVREIVRSGLASRYPGEARNEEIAGRPVLVLQGMRDRLYVHASSGLVVVGDHPLAVGLLLRGLERQDFAKRATTVRIRRLEVRYGRGADRWTGWMYGKGESVSWPESEAGQDEPAPMPPVGVIAAVALRRPRDVPVLPVPVPALLARAGSDHLVRRSVAVVLTAAGDFFLSPINDDAGVADHLPGGATRLEWLRALAGGRLASPIPAVDTSLLQGPLAEAMKGQEGDARLIPWTAGDRAGELRGPAWHGPATMMALRTLYHLCRGAPPGEVKPPAKPAPAEPARPLPPPADPRDLPADREPR